MKRFIRKISTSEVEYLTMCTYRLCNGKDFDYQRAKTFSKNNLYNKWQQNEENEENKQNEQKNQVNEENKQNGE